MSRVGNKPIPVPAGVTVKLDGDVVTVSGSGGDLSQKIAQGIQVKVDDSNVVMSRSNDEKKTRSIHGTMRSLVANMVEGVGGGFKKELEIQGIGFKAQLQGQTLVLTVGFSHSIEYQIPDSIDVKVVDNTKISVSGADKQLVGQVSARIRAFCPAEPYKGKGIRYKGENIRRKAGKTVA